MSELTEVVKWFEEKDEDQDELLVSHLSDNELYVKVTDRLDEEEAAFVFGDNDKDRERAKQLLEVIQSYINKSK
jgi:hypothetical protein